MDTFLGSGTTAIACKSTNRKFLGCEINKIYYDEIYSNIMALYSNQDLVRVQAQVQAQVQVPVPQQALDLDSIFQHLPVYIA